MTERLGFVRAFGAAAVLLLACAVSAAAQGTPVLKRLSSLEDVRPWQAIGRLEIGGAGFCSGALISRLHVLTAAHCVFDSHTREPIPPAELEFRVGLRDGGAIAVRRAKRVAVRDGYDPKSNRFETRAARDVAVIELEYAVADLAITPLPVQERLRKGQRVAVVSYGKGREEVPSLQTGCQVLDEQGGMWLTDCNLTFGSSGAPIMAMTPEGAQVASVVSGGMPWRGRNVSIGAPLDDSVEDLLAELGVELSARRVSSPALGKPKRSLADQLNRAPTSGLPQIRN
ncbi:MAG: trypsin-like peptidase domain-containing protein [Pseudomonadota bacterium]